MDVEDFLRNWEITFFLRLVWMYILDSKETFGSYSSHEISPSVLHALCGYTQYLVMVQNLDVHSSEDTYMREFLNLPPTL